MHRLNIFLLLFPWRLHLYLLQRQEKLRRKTLKEDLRKGSPLTQNGYSAAYRDRDLERHFIVTRDLYASHLRQKANVGIKFAFWQKWKKLVWYELISCVLAAGISIFSKARDKVEWHHFFDKQQPTVSRLPFRVNAMPNLSMYPSNLSKTVQQLQRLSVWSWFVN